MKEVKLRMKKSEDYSYGIFIESGLAEAIAKSVKGKYSSFCIIADSNTENLFGKNFLAEFEKEGMPMKLISFRAGEERKNLTTVEKLLELMISYSCNRKSIVIALGGGVVGDVAGFCANSFMRGIDYIQVPTTLLAMVDSSIGGKTGVNLKNGKNLCGSFLQPKAVFIDPLFIKTLPKAEIMNGLAEIIKHAIIKDEELFCLLSDNTANVLNADANFLETIIHWNCRIKAEVVQRDEKEENLRKILNFGHTIGHAIESQSNYSISHGCAVAKGLYYETKLSQELGFINEKEVLRIKEILEKSGFNLSLKFDSKKLVESMKSDKKNSGSKISFVLPSRIGKMKTIDNKYAIEVEDKKIIEVLEKEKKFFKDEKK